MWRSRKLVTACQQREGGGFLVSCRAGRCNPFLMLDHAGPVQYGPGEAVGAPDNPHCGFETVSYIISGSVQHKDSAGNRELSDGWVQWMTAGSGVVHSEMPSDEFLKKGWRMDMGESTSQGTHRHCTRGKGVGQSYHWGITELSLRQHVSRYSPTVFTQTVPRGLCMYCLDLATLMKLRIW